MLLVVEDEESLRTLVVSVLEQDGYQVQAAEDFDGAVDHLRRAAPGIRMILTDIVLPGPSGAALARHVRQNYPAVKLAFMSGYTGDFLSPDDRDVPLLRKPFSFEDLRAVVRSTLD